MKRACLVILRMTWIPSSLVGRLARSGGAAAAAAIAFLAASHALAVAGPLSGRTLTVKIPFAFRAGESGFSPGEYVISLKENALQDGETAGSVKLESRDRGRSVSIHVQRSRAAVSSAAPAVSFRAYGDQRFLAWVHTGEAGRAWEVSPSADERAAALHWGAPAVLSLKADFLPPS